MLSPAAAHSIPRNNWDNELFCLDAPRQLPPSFDTRGIEKQSALLLSHTGLGLFLECGVFPSLLFVRFSRKNKQNKAGDFPPLLFFLVFKKNKQTKRSFPPLLLFSVFKKKRAKQGGGGAPHSKNEQNSGGKAAALQNRAKQRAAKRRTLQK